MADYDSSEQENFGDSLNPALVFALLKSSELFPIDFDDAWQWVGWTRKSTAKEILISNFVESVDFCRKGFKSPSGGRPSEWILLTVDCFKSLAMMAGTPKGRRIRQYFLWCEAELKRKLEQEQETHKKELFVRLSMISRLTGRSVTKMIFLARHTGLRAGRRQLRVILLAWVTSLTRRSMTISLKVFLNSSGRLILAI